MGRLEWSHGQESWRNDDSYWDREASCGIMAVGKPVDGGYQMKCGALSLVGWTVIVGSLLVRCPVICAAPEDILEQHGDVGRQFEEIEIGPRLVYFHQRMMGEAIVEKDYIVYQLDRDSGELLARKSHWREDLPAALSDMLITEEEAIAVVGGEVEGSRLYIISPESDVFPLDPTPENPCWVVRSFDEYGVYTITIVDAMTGQVLGDGVPPPYTAFSMTGPQDDYPCSGAWTSWSQSAESWFNAMGYSTEEVVWPEESLIQSHIQSDETAMFYELAHGGSSYFAGGCAGGSSYVYTYATEIEAWMAGYVKMPFAFIGSCDGMCSTGNNTFAYEFRQGSDINTTVVGYCGMSEPQCDVCWGYSLSWQNALFNYMNQGYAVKDAFDQANADYPVCAGTNNCMRFAGDEDFAVVPVVSRRYPANNTCEDAIAATNGTYGGSTAFATNNGSASCGLSNSSPDVWYTWTSGPSGTLIAETCASAYDTVIS
ncbi:MAG: PepSY domain-containing protein, partial [Planctomycetota bacterium]